VILQPSIPLRLVDARDLGEACREVLRPGELVTDAEGRLRRLPRYFYEITSWEQALQTQLTEHFGLWELIDVDVREAPAQSDYPRYGP
jgi:hypothetical protein